MKWIGLLLMFLCLTGACDGTALPDGGHSDAAARGDHPEDADTGRFACGNAFCEATQICLTPAYGCITFAPLDGGTCPAGSHISDGGTDCLQDPPTPSCATLAAGAGAYDCSQGAGGACSIADAPVPASCGHICRAICF